MEIGAGSGRSIAGPSSPEPRARRIAGHVNRLQSFRQFFTAGPVACPYVTGRAERKLIVELTGAAAAEFYDELSRAGFRRSQGFAYRPACPQCTACVPVRIAVGAFAHSRSTRRVRNANHGLTGKLVAARATPEHYQLFIAYQRARHGDSDMATMTYADYRSLGTWSILWLVEECRRQGLPYVYLGYWIGESPKMAYKARFPGVERLTDE